MPTYQIHYILAALQGSVQIDIKQKHSLSRGCFTQPGIVRFNYIVGRAGKQTFVRSEHLVVRVEQCLLKNGGCEITLGVLPDLNKLRDFCVDGGHNLAMTCIQGALNVKIMNICRDHNNVRRKGLETRIWLKELSAVEPILADEQIRLEASSKRPHNN